MDLHHEKNQNTLVFVLGFLAFWANGDNYAAAPLLVSIASDLGLPVTQAGLSITAYMLTFGLFTILFGPLADKFGKSRIIKTAAVGTAVFSILGGMSFNFTSLVIFRSFNGAFGAGIFPVTLALIGATFSDKDRHGAIAKIMGFMFLGGASATLIGGIMAQIGSWRGVYFLYGVAELALALVVIKLIPNEPISTQPLNFKKSYSLAFARPALLLNVATIFFVGFSVFGSFSFAGHYVLTRTGLPMIGVGLIITAFGLGTVLGSRVLPKVRPRLGNRFLPTFGILGFGALILVTLPGMMVVPLLIGTIFLVTGFLGFGISFVALQSTLVMASQEQLPTMRGTAMSMASFGMFVGGGIGTQVYSMFIASGFIPLVYGSAGFMILITALVTGYRFSRSPGKPLATIRSTPKISTEQA